MKCLLILGGYGQTGRLLARHLLQHTDADLILAGRSLEKAQALAGKLNAVFPGTRVRARRADAASWQSMEDALHGSDMLVVAAPTTQHAGTVVQAALDAGVDYLDVQLSAAKLAALQAAAPQIEHAGRCFITEAGYHPGLPSAMVRYAALHLDQMESALTAGYLNMGKDLPYTEAVDELMEAFKEYQAQVFKNGAWSKPGSYDTRRVDFGGEIGQRNCYSMFFEELRALPGLYPSLRDLGFYIAGSSWISDNLITLLVLLGLKLFPVRGVRPLGKLMWWGMQTFNKPPYTVLLKVQASGQKDGHPAGFSASISHANGYELTAIPVAACLMQVLDGSAHRPGLWMMGHLVEPRCFFKDMQLMGVKITQSAS